MASSSPQTTLSLSLFLKNGITPNVWRDDWRFGGNSGRVGDRTVDVDAIKNPPPKGRGFSFRYLSLPTTG